MWKVEILSNLSPHDVYAMIRLRIDVFVVEQTRIYSELDDIDLEAIHVLYIDDNHRALAYGRIYETNGVIHFGRVATAFEARGTGLGRQLIDRLMKTIHERWPTKEVHIAAQVPVAPLYEKYGFQSYGDRFIYEGTEHINMVYHPY